jgi:hypothetical protein
VVTTLNGRGCGTKPLELAEHAVTTVLHTVQEDLLRLGHQELDVYGHDDEDFISAEGLEQDTLFGVIELFKGLDAVAKSDRKEFLTVVSLVHP